MYPDDPDGALDKRFKVDRLGGIGPKMRPWR
jgi:hypothetical protein